MGIRWTPRSLLTVSLGAIAVLGIALALLGWMLVEQDRDLERTRVTERLTYAVDIVIADLRQRLDGASKQLTNLASEDVTPGAETASAFSIRGDAVVVVVAPQGLSSSAPLVFYPDQPDPVDGRSTSNPQR